MNIRLFTLFLSLIFAAPAAFAHDASMHKGKATTGEVISVAGDELAVKTDAGGIRVKLGAVTRVELEDGRAAAKGDLKVGDRVMVTGTKLSGGELVAKEVMIHGTTVRGKESRAGTPEYTCTMHPEVSSGQPGKCPKCGMKLVRKD